MLPNRSLGDPRAKLAFLSLLYLCQGLPYGFQATALPAYLRAQSLSLTQVSLVGLLAIPWLLKALWAPLVDRYGHAGFGFRKSWIVPCQIGMGLAAWGCMLLNPANQQVLLATVLLMNLLAATMDIAVDGLAVDLLSQEQLGLANSAQVVGFKVGMLTGGGLLVWASASIGWHGLFGGMGIVLFAAALITLCIHEPPRWTAQKSPPQLGEIARSLSLSLRQKQAGYILAAILFYKLGESLVDTMWKPYLIDQGFSISQLGKWLGTYGMGASMAGSLFGGWLASNYSLKSSLSLTAALRIVPLAASAWLSTTEATPSVVIVITALEHFFGGAITTVMFTFMMSQVNKRVGASHYTILASIEVLGKSPASWLSGLIADATGYTLLFGLGTILSALYVGLCLVLPTELFRPRPSAVQAPLEDVR